MDVYFIFVTFSLSHIGGNRDNKKIAPSTHHALQNNIIYRRSFNTLEEALEVKKIKLKDESYIEYYENLQIRKDKDDRIIVQYLQTTTGRVLLNYTIQTTLNIEL